MVKVDRSELTFTSGRKIYANGGIIGLSPELELSGGYDQAIYIKRYGDLFEDDEAIFPEDISELADYMIDLWHKLKAKHGA